jgi:predicted DNA-binding transcriptional regulator AlpA
MNYLPEVTGRAPLFSGADDDRVMTFAEWCLLNGFSQSTGQRLIASGQAPVFIQLSLRRKGVTVGENRRWQQSRANNSAD